MSHKIKTIQITERELLSLYANMPKKVGKKPGTAPRQINSLVGRRREKPVSVSNYPKRKKDALKRV